MSVRGTAITQATEITTTLMSFCVPLALAASSVEKITHCSFLGDEALHAHTGDVLGFGHQGLDGDAVIAWLTLMRRMSRSPEDGVQDAEGRGVGGAGRAPVQRDRVVRVADHFDRPNHSALRTLLLRRRISLQVTQDVFL